MKPGWLKRQFESAKKELEQLPEWARYDASWLQEEKPNKPNKIYEELKQRSLELQGMKKKEEPQMVLESKVNSYHVHTENSGWSIDIKSTKDGDEPAIPFIEFKSQGHCGTAYSSISIFASHEGRDLCPSDLEEIGKFFLESAWILRNQNKKQT